METVQSARGYQTPESVSSLEGNREILRRLDRVENAVAGLQSSTALEDRVVARLGKTQASYNTPAEAETPPKGSLRKPTLLGALRWLFQDVVPELRGMVSMFFDPRYELGIPVRMVMLGLFAMLITTTWWVPFSSVPVLGFILDRTMMLASGYLLFKLLSSESRKYRQTAPALPANLRWPGRGER